MLRLTTAVLALSLVLGVPSFSSNAFARDGGVDPRGNVFRDSQHVPLQGGRNFKDKNSSFGDIHGLHGRVRVNRGRDVWGHWGAYYGPMISNP
jgi:hypothetical protein